MQNLDLPTLASFRAELLKIASDTQRVPVTRTLSDGTQYTVVQEELTSGGRAKSRALFDRLSPAQRRDVTDHIPPEAAVLGATGLGLVGGMAGKLIAPQKMGPTLAGAIIGAVGGGFGGHYLGKKEQESRVAGGSKAFDIGPNSTTGMRTLSRFNNSVAGKRIEKELKDLNA